MIAHGVVAPEDLPPTAAISVVTIGELHAGVLLAREARIAELRRGRLAAVRAAFRPLPVDEAVAQGYGEVLAVARGRGRPAKATDVLIIATAAATERTLYTFDHPQAQLASAAGIAVRTG